MYTPFWNDGDDYWDKLLTKYANVSMVVCGHIGVDNIVCTEAVGDNGNTVYQILSDPQYSDELAGGLGFVTLMHFTEDGSIMRMESYSTVMEKYFRETNYDLTFDLGEPPKKSEPQTTGFDSTWIILVIAAVVVVVAGALTVTVILIRKKKTTKV